MKKLEAKQVALLRHPNTREVVGKLYHWESGGADPMWTDEEVLDAIAEPLPGESSEWANWTLGGPSEPEV